MRVARVRVEGNSEARELADCWIAVTVDEGIVQVWTSPEHPEPALTAPLVDTIIEWSAGDAPARGVT